MFDLLEYMPVMSAARPGAEVNLDAKDWTFALPHCRGTISGAFNDFEKVQAKTPYLIVFWYVW